jgi:hypothetical protein
MAGQKPTTFTPESAERIARVVRAIENRPPKNPLNPDFDLPAMGANWQFIKITGAITGGDTGCNAPDDVDAMTVVQYYPGIIRQYNSETELWEDTGHTCWINPAPGQVLRNGDYVIARQTRSNACILGVARPLFTSVVSPASSLTPFCIGPMLAGYECVDNGDGTFTPSLSWNYIHYDGTTVTYNATPCP